MFKILVLAYALTMTVNGTQLNGVVKDNDSKESLSNVQVIINQIDTLYTNENGNFNFNLGEEELKTIELNLGSYEPRKYIFVEEEQGLLKGNKRKRDK